MKSYNLSKLCNKYYFITIGGGGVNKLSPAQIKEIIKLTYTDYKFEEFVKI